ncbi:hypothetical protein GCM10008023_05930 [Sphingomonas glacialis]|uniref:Phage gp6-like head-tail connector protein n=1 Tax=Sphingomonas glacialis TaxID=658225 RepID=A0ABQ3LIL6_9SPHN|nr:head-tail connector protein [Sphingomonas glacialis]GHH09352.1 hypothetical protein GCM10008023_05930 [Sphingomonas glacialis]
MTDLTTLANFKAYAGVTGGDDDTAIQALISAYSGYVRQYCNRDFTLGSYSRTFDGRNQTRQMLPQYPVQSVTAVQIDTQVVPLQATFGQAGFRFDAQSVMLNGYRFCRGEGNVLISWTAGYATVPLEIAQAVNELVGLRYELRDKQGWSSKSLAGETVSLITADMPSSVRTILANYRAVVPL